VSGYGKDGRLPGEEATGDLYLLGRILAGSPAGTEAAALLSGEASQLSGEAWARLADLARRQGVAALLYWRLGQGNSSAPPAVRDALREDLYTAAAQWALAEGQLVNVLGALARAGVPVVVVKGAALGAFYPDPALRLYGDIDLLVPGAQLDVAERALNDLGYHCFAAKDWWLDRFHHLPPMASESGGLLVELHWRLDYDEGKGRLPSGDLWARAVPWAVHGQPALRLEPVDAALYVCRHAVVQHRVHGALRPLCDLAWLVTGWGEAEWAALARRAADYGLERPVYLLLVLAGEVLALDAPEGVISALRPGGAPPAGDLARLLVGSGGAAPARVSAGAVQAAAGGSLGARLRGLLRHLFLPPEGMAAVYGLPEGSPRIWLAYLWRPVDLLRRYGLPAWRALRGDGDARAAWQREMWLERWLRGDGPPDALG
jgi:hypothetical protein